MAYTQTSRIWIAAALLAREQPDRRVFEGPEVLRRARELRLPQPEPNIQYSLLSQHCIANQEPSSYRIRYLYREPNPSSRTVLVRLFREGDDYHPDRKSGKITPKLEELPPQYQHLLAWYRDEYVPNGQKEGGDDPVLALRGAGKALWKELGGVNFVFELRANWFGDSRLEAETGYPEPAALKEASE